MEWLSANWFWLLVLFACLLMHLSHGHGGDGHGGSNGKPERGRGGNHAGR